MKILLVGEASNLHWTLAEGLRVLGHKVTVVSNGSNWMNNKRDINLTRKSYGFIDSISYLSKVIANLPRFRGYDVVQIRNPVFFELRPEKNLAIFNYLKKNNHKIFLDALSGDHYYVKTCLDGTTFRYSDLCIGNKPLYTPQREKIIQAWIGGLIEKPNIEIAQNVNGIIACLYEYYKSYESEYKDKLIYIPIPINLSEHKVKTVTTAPDKVNFFIGTQKDRSALKGTDVMYEVLQEIKAKYPDSCHIKKVVSVPLTEYNRMMLDSDILIDQLYSYTPATNALGAMAKGLVAVSGAEPEFYEMIGETSLRPIINILPDKNDIYNKFKWIIDNKEEIPRLSRESREFVKKHHDHVQVAKQYIEFWQSH